MPAPTRAACGSGGGHRPCLRERGEDQHRLEPFAEDDDGRVCHDRRRRLRAGPDGVLRVGERAFERHGGRGELRRCDLAAHELREAGRVTVPVPEQPLDADEQLGSQPAQALFRPELEDRVGLETSLLGGAVLACGGRAPKPAQRRADDVEVRARGRALPTLGKAASARSSARPGRPRRVRARRPWYPVPPCRATDRVARAPSRSAPSRRGRAGIERACRSPNAWAAPSRKVIASWISKRRVTRPSATPRPYSTGTRPRKRGTARRGEPPRRARAGRLGSCRVMREALRNPRRSRVAVARSAQPRAARTRRRAARQQPRRADRGTRARGAAKYPLASAASPAARDGKPVPRRSSSVSSVSRRRPWYVSSRSARTAATAWLGRRAPAGERAEARVASAPAARSGSAGGTRARAATREPPRRARPDGGEGRAVAAGEEQARPRRAPPRAHGRRRALPPGRRVRSPLDAKRRPGAVGEAGGEPRAPGGASSVTGRAARPSSTSASSASASTAADVRRGAATAAAAARVRADASDRESGENRCRQPPHVATARSDAELGRSLRHLPRDRRRPGLGFRAERVGLLGREAPAGLLLRVEAGDEVASSASSCFVCRPAPCRPSRTAARRRRRSPRGSRGCRGCPRGGRRR